MQQITLELGSDEVAAPPPAMNPQQEQRLVAVMAEAILTLWQSGGGETHEPD